MDFSSNERALTSLQRRQPSLSPETLVAAGQLLDQLTSASIQDPASFIDCTTTLLRIGTDGERWEPLAVGLHLTAFYLEKLASSYVRSDGPCEGGESKNVFMDGPRVPSLSGATQKGNDVQIQENLIENETLERFSEIVTSMCHVHLEHNEPRVRTLVAKVVGEFTKLGKTLYGQSNTTIMKKSMELYQSIVKSLYEHLDAGRDTENKSKSSTGALDDTTGWRALETNLYGMGSFVNGYGALYLQKNNVDGHSATFDDKLLESIEYCCVTHINRHVRAAGIAFLEQMVHACAASFATDETMPGPSDECHTVMKSITENASKMRKVIIQVLKATLADNWSQVRMAASVLNRVFLTTLIEYGRKYPEKVDDDFITSMFPVLVPRMCLNRFYLAQGVKLYSHDTWKIVFDSANSSINGGGGMESLAQNAGAVCRYYAKMCDADNHVVREAGCQAVAELATRLGRSEEYAEYLAPFVPVMLQALLMCFHDESWPVRDEACLACGTFCLAYPEECEPELPTLFERWSEQLTDQIWSVREDAAVALGDAIEAYGVTMLEKVLAVLKKNLPSAKDQPAMTMEEYKRRQNDIDSHTNSQLYSCGSLAPKLRKGGAGRIGCSDCAINRPKAPWEATDGCIYLIRELCTRLCVVGPGGVSEGLKFTDDDLYPIMHELVDVCRVKHFPQSDDLRTTLWKQLPVIAQALGKQRFKRKYLQMFLDILMNNMEDRGNASQLSVHAAKQCAEELSKLVGVSIFRGRLEEDWQVELFDNVMNERSQMPKPTNSGCFMEETFSPFGPTQMI